MYSTRTHHFFAAFALLAAAAVPAAAGPDRVPAAAGTNQVRFADITGTTGVNISFANGTTTFTQNNVAAGDYHLSVNGGPLTSAFCTDVWDEVAVPETWTATAHQTSAADGLASASSYYQVAPSNISAIDYIGQNYSAASSPQQAAAQLAIWDLVQGGGVTMTGSNYAWSNKFSETGVNAADVYGIEQAALGAKGPQGSLWLQAVSGSQSAGGRPQDFVTAGSAPAPAAVPEPSSLSAFGVLSLGLAVLLVRARKRLAAPNA